MPMRPAWAKRVGGCSQAAKGQIDSAVTLSRCSLCCFDPYS